MTSSKHPKLKEGEGPGQNDLERDPGIGRSKGSFATGEPPETLAGANTDEGDVENDPAASGAVSEGKLGRRNK